MSGIERKLFYQTVGLGLTLTFAVYAVQLVGWLVPMEQWLYHQRARVFQYFTPPPTKQLIHMDIDNPSLDIIGKWPWHRSDLGALTDEIAALGAKAVALDIIMPEASEVRLIADDDGTITPMDDDAVFAEAIHDANNILVPVSLKPEPEQLISPLEAEARQIMFENLELTTRQMREMLRDRGHDPERAGTELANIYVRARRWAVYERIDDALAAHGEDLPVDQLLPMLLPSHDPLVKTAASRVIVREHQAVAAMRALRRFSKPAATFDGTPLEAFEALPPVEPFGRAAAVSGYVDFLPYRDGVVRGIPLWLKFRDRLYPHFSVALLCEYLGTDPRAIDISPQRIVIPNPNGDPIVIPVHSHRDERSGRTFDLFVDVPWWGPTTPTGWELMYDYPVYLQSRQHMPLSSLWQIVENRRQLRNNCRFADDRLLYFYEYQLDQDSLREYEADRPKLDEWEPRRQRIESMIAKLEPVMQDFQQLVDDGDEFTEEELRPLNNFKVLQQLLDKTPGLVAQIGELQAQVRNELEGKAVIIGWTASAAAADFVPTPLHASAPGPIVHGALFNAMLTGNLWRTAPPWLAPLLTVLLGVLTTLVAAGFSPGRGAVAAGTIAIAWVLINGLWLFDFGNMIVDIGAPMLGIAVVWGGCTIFRWIAERAERARITARFRNYVDPALVDFVIEHPERSHLDGEERELSVVFTDLAGFTTISETLREKTVPLLNRYMGLMVPIIRERNGYVNKFLGDGIMFFYGAPRGNTYHAADAVSTVLKMQAALPRFNADLAEQGLPSVHMRVGVVTGKMVVGDAGPPDASDYTVLGDSVNLAARLESANKQTGTSILINHRTAALLQDLFLLRPIARLQVKGKSLSVMTYEPICYMSEATETQKKLVEATEAMVDAYIAGQFAECIELVDKLDDDFGPSRLTEMYREACQKMIMDPGIEFAGQMILTEK